MYENTRPFYHMNTVPMQFHVNVITERTHNFNHLSAIGVKMQKWQHRTLYISF